MTRQVWSVEQNPEDELFIVLDLSLVCAAVTHKKEVSPFQMIIQSLLTYSHATSTPA